MKYLSTGLLLQLLSSSAVHLDLLDKTNIDLATKTVSNGINDFVKEQKEKIDHIKNYTFGEFRKNFNRGYSPGSTEFIKREKIFKKNLQYLALHNTGPAKSYIMGINKFMDFTEVEFRKMLGYKRVGKGISPGSFMQGARVPQWNDTISAVALPSGHDWRPKLTRSRTWFQDQGACGSCWATAAIECLQNHLEIKHGISDHLSTQAIVSCTPNPQHCGGTGGCQGATAELAFEYIAKAGLPSEGNWPYSSFTGSNGKCSPKLAKMKHAHIDHHIVLPENQGEPLMQALYQEGPVVVSVDATNWNFYSGGIFNGCDKNAIINHAVVAGGFGEQAGHKYYLIKNSWGADWGEKGYMRLARFDSDEDHCGIDSKPEEGTACDGGPKEVRVCGMCGILYDSTYPRGVKFMTREEGGTFDEKQTLATLPMKAAKSKLMDMLKGAMNPLKLKI